MAFSSFVPVVVFLVCIALVRGVTEVEVVRQAYNFATTVTINDTEYQQVVDSGSYQLFTYIYNYSSPAPTNETQNCMSLNLDSTDLRFQGDTERRPCTTKEESVSIGTAVAAANASTAPYLYIENEVLHDWYAGNGVMGMSYCIWGSSYDCSTLTPFQMLIKNASGETGNSESLLKNASQLLFGLDLRSPDSDNTKYTAPNSFGNGASALQLGGYDAQFASSLVWTQQATQQPYYHQFFLDNLDFCGAQILGNYSTNWNVLIDTGSVCLSLPGELYDSFEAWIDVNDTVVEDVNALPAFTFKVSDGQNATTLHIPLADLLVDEAAIETEVGAPYVSVRDAGSGAVRRMRLCVLSGGDIKHTSNGGTTTYYTSAPTITLGALALQSIYVAADFSQRTVGLANKLSASYIAGFSGVNRVGCAAVQPCRGDQSYYPFKNSCANPQCTRYFFTELDHETMKCEPKYDHMAGGLVFIILIALAEIVSFLVMQHSANEALGEARMAVDPVTKRVGARLSVVVDFVVVYLLSWAPRPYSARTVGVAGAGRRGGSHNE